jgi:biopolymer transport protein ExbD
MAALDPGDDDVISAINITPFVDIVLVLLIIFMVTSTAIVKATLQVELPKAASGNSQVESTLNIVFTKDEQLLLNGAALAEAEMVAAIRAAVATNPKVQAVIAADKGVAYGRVVHIIDLVKQNGVASFALNIEREAAKPSE